MIHSPGHLAVTAGISFASISAYISLVQHPVAETIRPPSTYATYFSKWIPRVSKMQGGLAISSAALSLTQAYQTPKEKLWIASGVVIGSIIPFTLAAIFPINEKIVEAGVKAEKVKEFSNVEEQSSVDEKEVSLLLRKWGQLHWIRTLLSIVSVGIMATALHKTKKL